MENLRKDSQNVRNFQAVAQEAYDAVKDTGVYWNVTLGNQGGDGSPGLPEAWFFRLDRSTPDGASETCYRCPDGFRASATKAREYKRATAKTAGQAYGMMLSAQWEPTLAARTPIKETANG